MKHKFDISETVVDWTIPEIPRTGFRSAAPDARDWPTQFK
jgi:hypothetical protein